MLTATPEITAAFKALARKNYLNRFTLLAVLALACAGCKDKAKEQAVQAAIQAQAQAQAAQAQAKSNVIATIDVRLAALNHLRQFTNKQAHEVLDDKYTTPDERIKACEEAAKTIGDIDKEEADLKIRRVEAQAK